MRTGPAVSDWHGLRSDGTRLPLRVELSIIVSEDAAELYLVQLRAAPEESRSCSQWRLLAQAVAQTDDAILITDAAGTIEYVNPGFERVSGYHADELIGRRPGMLKSGEHPAEFYRDLWQRIGRGEVFRAVFVNRRKNGELYYEEKTISPICGEDGAISHYVSTAKDVTDRVRAEERLEHLANYDALTGLPNRALFLDRMAQAMQRAERRGRQVALLFLDLDRFKVINDTLGHTVGDQILCATADRLRTCVRAGDTVARLGGDEFTVILEDIRDVTDVAGVANKILDVFGEHFSVREHRLFLSASIGVALYPADGDSTELLVKRADLSMYRAKTMGRNTCCYYERHMDAHALRDLSLETALRSALDNDEFHLVFQPIVDTRIGRAVAVEALLRWNSPEHGCVPPTHFVPLLEETGLILPVGRWALEEALRQARKLQHDGMPGLRLAFNLSGRQFRDPQLALDIERALARTQFDPRLLELEITESTLMENAPIAAAILASIEARGIRIAVDDFGTGYSSLSYLRHFHLSTLKVDRSFVAEMRSSGEAATIVRAVVSLAQGLGLDVVGEGVENYAQLALLQEFGCHCVQGYLLGRPVLPEELPRPVTAPAHANGCVRLRPGMLNPCDGYIPGAC